VVTFCVYHAEIAGPAWRPLLPYTVVVVHLWYSGIHMLSNLVCDDLRAVHIGIPVRVGFEVVNAWLTLPKFFLCSEGHTSEGKQIPLPAR
jgi:uncharacterized OB-fold protein